MRYCETHRREVPEGWVNRSSTVRVHDEHGARMVPNPKALCPGYGEVEYIDSDGWAELNRDPCEVVEYTPSSKNWLSGLPDPVGPRWPSPHAYQEYYSGPRGDRYADWISGSEFLSMQGKDEKDLDPRRSSRST
jgi:hypothetical protein